jgi:hypothetical protein
MQVFGILFPTVWINKSALSWCRSGTVDLLFLLLEFADIVGLLTMLDVHIDTDYMVY